MRNHACIVGAGILAAADGHRTNIPSVANISPVHPRRAAAGLGNSKALISRIRGGGVSAKASKTAKRSRRRSNGRKTNNDESRITAQSILLPRKTSLLMPIRLAIYVLMNGSFNSCIQTSGKPLEDAVRRLLDMPSPENDSFASKVTPLHVYVAKRISPSSEMIPPGHLPAPLPLLGLFLSILLYLGGTVLLPRWSVAVDAFLNYERIDVDGGGHALQKWFEEGSHASLSKKKRRMPAVLIQETDPSGGKRRPTLCSLFYSNADDASQSDERPHLRHPRRFYLELHQKRYYYDPSQSPAVVSGGPCLHELELPDLLSDANTGGLSSTEHLKLAQERYGPYYSDIAMPVPTLWSAFTKQISSPLVFLQLIGRLLALIEEETIGKAFANLARLGLQHFNDAKRSVASQMTFAEEVKGVEDAGIGSGGNESRFWAVRPATNREAAVWAQVSPKDLLPGDVFVIAPAFNKEGSGKQASSSLSIPVDAIVLEGTCVTMEAALTGESVPQAKSPLELAETELFDMSGHHRSSCIFSGTELLYSSSWDEGATSTQSMLSNLPPLPPETFFADTLPAMFLTLRTGSCSSRGEIIQSLLKSRTRVGATNKEVYSIRISGAMACVAAGACLFLLLGSSEGPKASIYKRIVQCTRIVVASVPSDLPASLAACSYACAMILREEADAVSSDAGALAESSKVDTVVFDKTGTLTADTQALRSIEYPPIRQQGTKRIDVSAQTLAEIVLAGGHSLIGLGDDSIGNANNLVGDPLDVSCLRFSDWRYNPHEKSATSPGNKMKLWQLRTFPFDPVKKMSSALVLAKNSRGVFRLWVVCKGSPSRIRNLISFEDDGREDVTYQWYNEKKKQLGEQGFRSVGLVALDATHSHAANALFPAGLPRASDSKSLLESLIHEARGHARMSLMRNDIECPSASVLGTKGFRFAGFACFNAPMRPSSPGVIDELKSSSNNVIMLTGDEAYASLAAAKKAHIMGNHPMCLLKTNSSVELVWEMNGKEEKSTRKIARNIERDVENKRSVLVVTGDAVSAVLSGHATDGESTHVERLLPKASLVASASPDDKRLFVNHLRNSCKREVLMCGDGVNDIAAMREATVSVAMLAGFGHDFDETASANIGDLRRKEKLAKRKIGSNRSNTQSKMTTLEDQGVGNTFVASCARIRRDVTSGMQQLQSEDADTAHHSSVSDVCLTSIQNEIKRYTRLKKGGSDAAKILAEEDRLRKSLESKAEVRDSLTDAASSDEIHIGESCLASSFTLLRPCISGVESILRTGISAAACSLTVYRKVTLNCILSCYNLATLYSNGLRYASAMWRVELASMVYTDNASFKASSTPRPRLVAGVRPTANPFHISEILAVISQAVIHIATLTCAVNSAKRLEETHPAQTVHRKGFGIRWSDGRDASAGSVLATLVGSPASNSLHSANSDTPTQSFFKRPSFQPNYLSNNVFLVSVCQSAITNMVNHSGRPFSISFLESRPLCVGVSLAFLLCVVCLAESFPLLNRLIKLAPYPTKASRVGVLRLLMLDASLSYLANYFSTFCFRHDIWKERNRPLADPKQDGKGPRSAADEEEKLLAEEREQNTAIVALVCLCILHFSVQIVLT